MCHQKIKDAERRTDARIAKKTTKKQDEGGVILGLQQSRFLEMTGSKLAVVASYYKHLLLSTKVFKFLFISFIQMEKTQNQSNICL